MAIAIMLTEPGGPDKLELRELPDPVAGPGELLIAVEAAGIAPADRGAVETGYGEKMPGAAPWILGWDLADTVTAGLHRGPGHEHLDLRRQRLGGMVGA